MHMVSIEPILQLIQEVHMNRLTRNRTQTIAVFGALVCAAFIMMACVNRPTGVTPTPIVCDAARVSAGTFHPDLIKQFKRMRG